MKKPVTAVLAAGAAAALVLSAAGPALAFSSSTRATYPNGVKLTANAYIQSLSGLDGCGGYASSAVIGATPVWVQAKASFHANGIGAAVGVGSASGAGADDSITWRNSNGARGSYLSGSVCTNWLTWSVSMSTTASAFYYGVLRTATASL